MWGSLLPPRGQITALRHAGWHYCLSKSHLIHPVWTWILLFQAKQIFTGNFKYTKEHMWYSKKRLLSLWPHESKLQQLICDGATGPAVSYRPDVHVNLWVEEVLLLLWRLVVAPNVLIFKFNDSVQWRSHVLLHQQRQLEPHTEGFVKSSASATRRRVFSEKLNDFSCSSLSDCEHTHNNIHVFQFILLLICELNERQQEPGGQRSLVSLIQRLLCFYFEGQHKSVQTGGQLTSKIKYLDF